MASELRRARGEGRCVCVCAQHLDDVEHELTGGHLLQRQARVVLDAVVEAVAAAAAAAAAAD
jgi:hypothetical protein